MDHGRKAQSHGRVPPEPRARRCRQPRPARVRPRLTIREHWPDIQIAIRDDSLTSRGDGVCDENGIDFVFGLAGNDVLRHLVEPLVDDVRVSAHTTWCRSMHPTKHARREIEHPEIQVQSFSLTD
jgi:hypothetical protein